MPIETYDNNDITEFARVFTGLGPAGYWNPWVDYSEGIDLGSGITLFHLLMQLSQW